MCGTNLKHCFSHFLPIISTPFPRDTVTNLQCPRTHGQITHSAHKNSISRSGARSVSGLPDSHHFEFFCQLLIWLILKKMIASSYHGRKNVLTIAPPIFQSENCLRRQASLMQSVLLFALQKKATLCISLKDINLGTWLGWMRVSYRMSAWGKRCLILFKESRIEQSPISFTWYQRRMQLHWRT